MITMELTGGLTAGRAFMDATRLVTRAVSLGDAATPFSILRATHATYGPSERAAHGFTDGLIRLSVGLEDYDDIRLDILTALDQMSK